MKDLLLQSIDSIVNRIDNRKVLVNDRVDETVKDPIGSPAKVPLVPQAALAELLDRGDRFAMA